MVLEKQAEEHTSISNENQPNANDSNEGLIGEENNIKEEKVNACKTNVGFLDFDYDPNTAQESK